MINITIVALEVLRVEGVDEQEVFLQVVKSEESVLITGENKIPINFADIGQGGIEHLLVRLIAVLTHAVDSFPHVDHQPFNELMVRGVDIIGEPDILHLVGGHHDLDLSLHQLPDSPA